MLLFTIILYLRRNQKHMLFYSQFKHFGWIDGTRIDDLEYINPVSSSISRQERLKKIIDLEVF